MASIQKKVNLSSNEIVCVNEIARAVLQAQKQNALLVYAPSVESEPQEKFHRQRFGEIQKHWPRSSFNPNLQERIKPDSPVFAWDADRELKKFKQRLASGSQNRLFTNISFEVPDSFTGFRKKAEAQLPSVYEDAIVPFDNEVKNRLQHYFYHTDCPSTYFETRNQLIGTDSSSGFSIYLSCGALDVRHLYNEIKLYEKRKGENKSTYWLIFELLWREFFYWHYQKWGKNYFSVHGIQGPVDFSNYETYKITALKNMSTDSFWQAALLELEQTGFQSNRTRQLFASFWLHELNLNWRAGAHLFEIHLIDYDVYSNWGNWMYLAGVGVDSRGSRRFDIPSQLNRYDEEGEYLTRWAPV